MNNTASGGGAIYSWYCDIIIDGEVELIGNTGKLVGGGMSAFETSVTTNMGHMRFIDNQAEVHGAALQIKGNRGNMASIFSANFLRNSVFVMLSQIIFVDINISGNTNRALAIRSSNITFIGLTRITENTASFKIEITAIII